ncbi:hypothetical protein AWJ19_17055 [Paenibacillus sp. DMB5]|nr:hypothetical protein AWJ19_17055 [Paenibacillus sp. DMB5]
MCGIKRTGQIKKRHSEPWLRQSPFSLIEVVLAAESAAGVRRIYRGWLMPKKFSSYLNVKIIKKKRMESV